MAREYRTFVCKYMLSLREKKEGLWGVLPQKPVHCHDWKERNVLQIYFMDDSKENALNDVERDK